MRLRLTLFLLILNAALFSYLYYLEGYDLDRVEQSRQVFPPGAVERAQEITIRGDRIANPWTALREGEQWMIERPIRWGANPYALQRLLDLLRSLRWETKFTVEELKEVGRELADYGLGEDSAVLTLRTEESELTLRIGAPTEIGSRLYLLAPSGDEVYVVDRDFLEGIDLSPENLVDRRVISIPPFEARSIFLQAGENGGIRVELAREGESWVLRAPIRVAASADAINAALESIYAVQISDFSDSGPQEHGLTTPFLRLNLNGNNRQQTLLLGEIVDPAAQPIKRYAKLEALPAVFTVEVAPFEVWQTAQESLRERHFMTFDPKQASAVQIESGERNLNLQKLESGRWQLVTSGDDGTLRTIFADGTVMTDLLVQLAQIEVLSFESDAPSTDIIDRAGLNNPQRRITVRLRDDRNLTLLLGNYVVDELGDDRGNRLFAQRENSSSIYITSASILAAVPLKEIYYRDRVAGSLPSGARLESIRLVDLRTHEPVITAKVHPSGVLLPVEGQFTAQEQTALNALADAFRSFPVRRFIADEFTDPLRLDAATSLEWAFAAEAEVRLTGSDKEERETRRYVLTERLGGMTQFVGNKELNLVFTIPLDLIDALHPVLFQRARPDASVNPTPAEMAPVVSPAPIPPLDAEGDATPGQ